MTEHLPECSATHLSDPPAWCICDELRACEHRIIRAESLRLEALHHDMANWSSAETQEALTAFPELTVDQWLWAQRGVRRSVQVLTEEKQ